MLYRMGRRFFFFIDFLFIPMALSLIMGYLDQSA